MAETVYYHERPSWLSYSGLLIISAAILLVSISYQWAPTGIVLSTIFALFAAFFRYQKQYTVTNQRIMMRKGLIANHTSEMELKHIRGMNIHQNVFERILGIGTLEIVSAADGGAEVIFQGISNPVGVKEKIRTIKGLP